MLAEVAGSPTDGSLHIAGIGASAGGLEAMLPMFARLPSTGRIAYVVAQHMAHNGHSELVVRLLQRESALPVVLALGGEQLQPDTIYVIPSGRDGQVEQGRLVLGPPGAGHLSTPSVNALFNSIAESHRHKAIGIVLSGTGSDGTAGCRAIKARGGLTLAQAPAEARFNGMPSAAIEARTIDQVLPAEAIGAVLAERFPGAAPPRQPAAASLPPPIVEDSPALRELERLLPLILTATGIDFSSYKEDTLLRRLEKRKAVLGLGPEGDYLALVRRQPEELRVLQQLFLVSVSSFFRDRESFRELERSLAGLVANKAAGEPIRIWVPACASGEEPFTLAIILAELLGDHRSQHPVQIIGTDLNPLALAIAREGVYRQTACHEMDADLRQRYLLPRGQHVEVTAALREVVSFEQRDVLAGPPGGEFDLISCRNLLIYLKSRLQDQLVRGFHDALCSQGLLFVGQSESLGLIGGSLFAAVNHYHRLYRRRN